MQRPLQSSRCCTIPSCTSLFIFSAMQARAEAAFEETRRWCNERIAFGKPLFDKQAHPNPYSTPHHRTPYPHPHLSPYHFLLPVAVLNPPHIGNQAQTC